MGKLKFLKEYTQINDKLKNLEDKYIKIIEEKLKIEEKTIKISTHDRFPSIQVHIERKVMIEVKPNEENYHFYSKYSVAKRAKL